jgi:hypothetical protein
MSNFPLYTTLKKNIPKKDLTIPQKNDLINKISEMQTEEHELIYALIKSYFLEKDKEQNVIVPYKGKMIKENIEFNLSDLPIELRQILFKFILAHEQKTKEEVKNKQHI